MKTFTCIVETPKDSVQKYDFDEKNKWFKLNKIMPAGMVFPFDFGFITATRGEDGDPLDVIMISEIKSFPGCVMDCRIVGAITAHQTEDGETFRNDRYIGIPEVSQMFAEIKSIHDLPDTILEQIEQFFINYNELADKKFKPLKRIDVKQALKLLNKN